jgi:hypothetical protein
MSLIDVFILASFTVPEYIGTNPQSMLWMLPLVMALTIVYKSTKMPIIKARPFIKEVIVTSSVIIFVYTIAAIVLLILTWLIT